uniref:Uncharacterized protein n=1 Tax=Oryza sativa subsp. japonica TaxID=39947 RepID=Q5Z5I0_ORYSJ|nr:hypothetical protein [Oryza sativa Japonica Group]
MATSGRPPLLLQSSPRCAATTTSSTAPNRTPAPSSLPQSPTEIAFSTQARGRHRVCRLQPPLVAVPGHLELRRSLHQLHDIKPHLSHHFPAAGTAISPRSSVLPALGRTSAMVASRRSAVLDPNPRSTAANPRRRPPSRLRLAVPSSR